LSDISGKTLILVGASGGIGRALALALADEEVALVLNARTHAAVEKVADECSRSGARVDFLAGSAARGEVAEGLVKRALNLGNFYGFIQAAGTLHPGPAVFDLSEKEFSEIFEASVTASFQLARAAFPPLIEAGAGIAVFLGSGVAERVVRGMGAYSAAKAAEEHLVRHLAADAPQITSLVFRPGVVDTPMVRRGIEAATKLGFLTQAFIPAKMLSAEDVADAVVSLVRDDSKFGCALEIRPTGRQFVEPRRAPAARLK